MSKPATKALEDQLLPVQDEDTHDPYLSHSPENDAYLNLDDGEGVRIGRFVKRLEGDEACKFLGIPVRTHYHMRRDDYRNIHRRFKPLFELWAQMKADDRTINLDPDNNFWKNIKIKVLNKSNLEVLSKTEIKGKPTKGCPSIGVLPGEYTGDLMDGRTFSTFLSTLKKSERWREYLVLLVGVDVAEEMQLL